MSQRRRITLWTVATLALLATPAVAQETFQRTLDASQALAHWSEARIAAARPFALAPRTAPGPGAEPVERALEESRSWAASPPAGSSPARLRTRLYHPGAGAHDAPPEAALELRAQGGAKAPFTSSQLVPLDADLFFPYVTVGKLFFEIPGFGPAYCSAAVIARRLIVTAAQCVHSGTPSPGFFDAFMFAPSYRDGEALGVWPATVVFVTGTWANGGGFLPSPADFAILELDELLVDGSFEAIGDVLGWLGWRTNGLRKNHVHMLGYSTNLDGGELMHQVTAAIKRYTGTTNTATAGSDMRGGAGGGPWIENFGFRSMGQQIPGGDAAFNRVVGVSSFVALPNTQKLVGSSMFNAQFVSLFTAACGQTPGNC